MENTLLSVSDFVAVTNQTLEYAYPSVSVVGEVTEFRVSQGKWVSFKLKDAGAVVGCFMTVYQLRIEVEDGMKLLVTGVPKLSPKGYFSLHVRALKPVGEGSIKKGFELLKAKLEAEGLFSPERKRSLPRIPRRVAVVTSVESAAYADFCKIIGDRWGGLDVTVIHTQVQGDLAADQMIQAIRQFNSQEDLADVLVLIRGGGSAEDLMAYNDEVLAREIAGSRIPTLVGVGHETDVSLADMVADQRAATPTNAAEILVPDRRDIIESLHRQVGAAGHHITQAIDHQVQDMRRQLGTVAERIDGSVEEAEHTLASLRAVVSQLNPERVLQRGYGLVRGTIKPGNDITIEMHTTFITAEVKDVRKK